MARGNLATTATTKYEKTPKAEENPRFMQAIPPYR
jgi:hypothetical protein